MFNCEYNVKACHRRFIEILFFLLSFLHKINHLFFYTLENAKNRKSFRLLFTFLSSVKKPQKVLEKCITPGSRFETTLIVIRGAINHGD